MNKKLAVNGGDKAIDKSNQKLYKDIKPEAGEHELIAGISPMENQEIIDWVIGIGDTNS